MENHAELRLLIVEEIKNVSNDIADKCAERIKASQHDCEAFRIFRKDENVKRFYNTEDTLRVHIDMHKKKEIESEKLFDKRYKLIMLFVGLLGVPSLVSVVIKIMEMLRISWANER